VIVIYALLIHAFLALIVQVLCRIANPIFIIVESVMETNDGSSRELDNEAINAASMTPVFNALAVLIISLALLLSLVILLLKAHSVYKLIKATILAEKIVQAEYVSQRLSRSLNRLHIITRREFKNDIFNRFAEDFVKNPKSL